MSRQSHTGGLAPGPQLLEHAVGHLREHTAGSGLDLALEHEASGAGTALLVGAQRYAVEVVSSAGAALRRAVDFRAARPGITTPDDGDRLLVVLPHMPRQTGARLTQLGVAHVDAAGNAHLRHGGVVVEVSGRPPVADFAPPKPRPARATRAAGLQVTFTLLLDESLVGAPLRRLAAAAGVSVGAAHGVRAELEQDGFVSGGPRSRRLARLPDLARRWVDQYAMELGPRTLLGQFDAAPGWWRAVTTEQLQAADALWGGESAADLVTGHLRTERGVLYAPALPTDILLSHRLSKASGDGAGPPMAEIRRRFWDPALQQAEAPAAEHTAPSLLVYADLRADGSPRLVEASEMLRRSDRTLRRLLPL